MRRITQQLALPAAWLGFSLMVVLVGLWVAGLAGVAGPVYWAQAIPTIAAVIAGIPIAVWLATVEDRQRQGHDRVQRSERAVLVLSLVGAELRDNLTQMHGDRAKRPRQVIVPFLRSETWRSFTASGELRWVDDPLLISRIATAYHRIDTTTTLERVLLDSAPVPQVGDSSAELFKVLARQDEHTIAAIDHALDGITKRTRLPDEADGLVTGALPR